VVGTGGADDLRRRFSVAETVELEGVVLPGFYDAHAHPTEAAANALGIDLSGEVVTSEEQLAAALASEQPGLADGTWVTGWRYDHGKTTGGRVIDRTWLDQVVPDRPALVLHVAGHWGVLNTLGLEAAGYDDDTPEPKGGALGRDGAGHLNGVVYEQAFFGSRRDRSSGRSVGAGASLPGSTQRRAMLPSAADTVGAFTPTSAETPAKTWP
jgi:predicted amidohydrolase YtcJ